MKLSKKPKSNKPGKILRRLVLGGDSQPVDWRDSRAELIAAELLARMQRSGQIEADEKNFLYELIVTDPSLRELLLREKKS
jgi:hypothetical protein